MYDERFVAPMRQELTRLGVTELRTAAAVDDAIKSIRNRPVGVKLKDISGFLWIQWHLVLTLR